MRKVTILAAVFLFVFLSIFSSPTYAVDGSKPNQTMEIINTVDVNIANQDPIQMEIVNGEPEPFQAYVSGAISGSNFEGLLSFDVDPDRRLRIDNFTASMKPEVSSNGCYIQIKTELNGIEAYHRFPLKKVATMTVVSPTYDVYMGGQEVCLYADPGSKVYIRFFRTTTGGSTDVTFSLTGYLEPLTSP